MRSVKAETEIHTRVGTTREERAAAPVQKTPPAAENMNQNMMQMFTNLLRTELSAKFDPMAGRVDQLLSRVEYLEASAMEEEEEGTDDEEMESGLLEGQEENPAPKQVLLGPKIRRATAGKARTILNKFNTRG